MPIPQSLLLKKAVKLDPVEQSIDNKESPCGCKHKSKSEDFIKNKFIVKEKTRTN